MIEKIEDQITQEHAAVKPPKKKKPLRRFAYFLFFISVLLGILAIGIFYKDQLFNLWLIPSGQESASQVPWCGSHLESFKNIQNPDEVITDWPTMQSNLGFTPVLLSTLPQNTCLVSVDAIAHDPVLGSRFTITYLLPDHTALTITETTTTVQSSFRCSTTNDLPNDELCEQSIGHLHVVLAAQMTTPKIQQLFGQLQPNINWMPK